MVLAAMNFWLGELYGYVTTMCGYVGVPAQTDSMLLSAGGGLGLRFETLVKELIEKKN